jgi:hypothetical protein
LNRHSANYLQEDFERVLKSIDDNTPNAPKVAGFVTDNTSTNRLMWDQLLLKYPSKYFYGCAAHALQLIVKWTFKKQPVKKAAALTSTTVLEDNEPLCETVNRTISVSFFVGRTKNSI